MVRLRYSTFTFCQFFLSSETRKLTAIWMFMNSSRSLMAQLPTATPRHSTFLSWNFRTRSAGRSILLLDS